MQCTLGIIVFLGTYRVEVERSRLTQALVWLRFLGGSGLLMMRLLVHFTELSHWKIIDCICKTLWIVNRIGSLQLRWRIHVVEECS